jgi:Restriction endonuclease
MPRYSRSRIKSMLKKVDLADTADAKGAALEDLASYLFKRIPGVELRERNILDLPRAHELDLAFWNDQKVSDLSFLEAVLIVECKANETPVSSAAVGWFVRKLQDHGAFYGILVALNGITGDGATSAHSEVLNALNRDRIKILLLSRQEILGLANTNDLTNILQHKLLRLTLHRAVHIDENV